MNLIELHILQSFPVSCLNRDDVGAPKSAVFGGVTRARLSSQCLKRASRTFARDEYPEAQFNGFRTRYPVRLFAFALCDPTHRQSFLDSCDAEEKRFLERMSPTVDQAFETLTTKRLSMEQASSLARITMATLNKLDPEKDEIDTRRVKTAMFLSDRNLSQAACGLLSKVPPELLEKLEELAQNLQTETDDEENGGKPKKGKKDAGGKKFKKAIKDAFRDADILDAADIALFGRMIANDASLNVEAAAMFSHALSTHEATNDIDFFSAVDERKTDLTDSGAGMIGTLEFTSALYYRYAALNLDLLANDTHLGGMTPEQRNAVVAAFLRSVIRAVPGARKASMNAATLPGYVLGIAKAKGQPLQLVNAFLKPTKANLEEASTTMKDHHANLKRIWGFQTKAEAELSETGTTSFDDFISNLTSHDA